jgi:hypoxanthine phosphoribosyltransferase
LINIKDKTFRPYISQADIQARVNDLADRLSKDYADKDPLFIVVLTGAFMFASDLVKELNIGCEVAFTRLSSYKGTTSTGEVKHLLGITERIEGRHVIIVEDIIDTGKTIHSFLPVLKDMLPASVSVATLIVKPLALKYPLDINYYCFSISNEFIVGYGLDYDGHGRNLKDIYQVVD